MQTSPKYVGIAVILATMLTLEVWRHAKNHQDALASAMRNESRAVAAWRDTRKRLESFRISFRDDAARVIVNNVTQEIVSMLTEQLGISRSSIERFDLLAFDLHCDSLDLVEIVMEIEDAFDINIADDALSEDLTVGDLVEIVAGKL